MRKVSPALAKKFGLKDEWVQYWHSLSDNEQEHYYADSESDIRSGVYWENCHFKAGQRGVYGRGCTLAQAVDIAFGDSPAEKERQRLMREQQKAAYEAEALPCADCGEDVARRDALVMHGGPKEVAFCKPCARKTELGRQLMGEAA